MNSNIFRGHPGTAVFFIVFALAALTASSDWSSDNELYLILADNFISGRIDIDPHYELLHWSDGRFYSWQDPGLALLILPVMLAARLAGGTLPGNPATALLPFFSPLAAALAAFFFYRLQREFKVPASAAALASLTLVFATSFWASATVFYHDAVQVMLVLAALWCLQRATYTGAALAFFWLVMLKGVNLLLLAAVIAWFVPDRRRLSRGGMALVAAAFLFAAALHLGYNYWRFDNPFTSGYQVQARQYNITFGTFSTPLLEGLWGLLGSPGKGLLVFAPPVILVLPAWPAFARLFPGTARFALTGTGLMLVVLAKYWGWHGDYSWGPRLLLPVLPLILLPLGFTLHKFAAAGRLWFPGLVILLGIGVQVLGLLGTPAVTPQMAFTGQQGISLFSLPERDPWSSFHFDPAYSPLRTGALVCLARWQGRDRLPPGELFPASPELPLTTPAQSGPFLWRLLQRPALALPLTALLALLFAALAAAVFALIRPPGVP